MLIWFVIFLNSNWVFIRLIEEALWYLWVNIPNWLLYLLKPYKNNITNSNIIIFPHLNDGESIRDTYNFNSAPIFIAFLSSCCLYLCFLLLKTFWLIIMSPFPPSTLSVDAFVNVYFCICKCIFLYL